MTILRKLSAKTICGEIEVGDEARNLFSVIGVVTGVRTGMSSYGEWVSFTGDFEAENCETGEIFTGPQVFVPEPIQSALLERVKNSESPRIELALMVGVKPADNAIGYEYITNTLNTMEQHDALNSLRQLREQAKKLSAPAKKTSDKKASAK